VDIIVAPRGAFLYYVFGKQLRLVALLSLPKVVGSDIAAGPNVVGSDIAAGPNVVGSGCQAKSKNLT
jgi:hypothetical protein